MAAQSTAGYAGDLSAREAYSILERDKAAVLVDVRTQAEWTYVGVPNLSELGKQTILVEWQAYPSMKVDADFAPRLNQALPESGADAPLLFLCRSGGRS